MKLFSTNFSNEGRIPEVYTCKGTNISPELHWEEIPAKVKSFCLLMDDPDAPVGDWVHWILTNIDPKTTAIVENSKPAEAIVGLNSWKKTSYGGPCPPSGTHRYFFKLYALDIMLDSKKHYTKTELLTAIEKHILADAVLMGKFKK